uniref:Dehydrogenase/reductase (SDR family) member 7Cb n=1 Tax=Sinocyclocheilus grahami TaxID=75366 RepID=A0A672KHJ8_SINGR
QLFIVIIVLPCVIINFFIYLHFTFPLLYTAKIILFSKGISPVLSSSDPVFACLSECARLFHEGGARLVLCGPSWDKLESLYDSLCSGSDPSKTFTPKLVLLDFSDMENISDVITEIGECYGCVDVLICNSSMKVKAPVQNLSLEMDKTVMDVNYFGPITLAKGVLPLMITRRTGQFVLVNSIQGKLYHIVRLAAAKVRLCSICMKHRLVVYIDRSKSVSNKQGLLFRFWSRSTDSSFVPDISSKLNTHGVSPSSLAHEIVRTVNRQNREVLLAHPVPWVALYIRSLLPSFFFAVVAAGVKDGAIAEQMK